MTPQQGASGDEPTVSGLAGKRVFLRSIYTEDYPYLRHIEFDLDDSAQYRHRGESLAPEQYPIALWNGVLSQFMICERADGQPVGIVSCFGADMRNQHARIAILLDPVVRGHGWPWEGFVLFLDYLFSTFPLRKLYADVLEPNLPTFKRGLEGVASVEGRLSQHEYLGGEYVDLLTYAIYRDDWASVVDRRMKEMEHLYDAESVTTE